MSHKVEENYYNVGLFAHAQSSILSVMPSSITVLCYKLVRNVMAHAQISDFVFPRNGRVHLNRWGRQFSRLLAAKVCASA